MKLKKVLWADHKGFIGLLRCEHCGYETKQTGPRTKSYLKDTIPTIECKKCRRTS